MRLSQQVPTGHLTQDSSASCAPTVSTIPILDQFIWLNCRFQPVCCGITCLWGKKSPLFIASLFPIEGCSNSLSNDLAKTGRLLFWKHSFWIRFLLKKNKQTLSYINHSKKYWTEIKPLKKWEYIY